MSPKRTTPNLTPNAAAEIARAERRREMLEDLTGIGMAKAEAVTRQVTEAKSLDEIAQSFADISRAVRLTIALEAEADALILALRKGHPLPVETRAAAGGPGSANAAPLRDAEEGSEEEALVAGPFRTCLEVICADLGLEPDWSLWSDEEGFVSDVGEPVRAWGLDRSDVAQPPA